MLCWFLCLGVLKARVSDFRDKKIIATGVKLKLLSCCLSADEWIKKLWYIYTMEYYSAIKRNTFESV